MLPRFLQVFQSSYRVSAVHLRCMNIVFDLTLNVSIEASIDFLYLAELILLGLQWNFNSISHIQWQTLLSINDRWGLVHFSNRETWFVIYKLWFHLRTVRRFILITYINVFLHFLMIIHSTRNHDYLHFHLMQTESSMKSLIPVSIFWVNIYSLKKGLHWFCLHSKGK